MPMRHGTLMPAILALVVLHPVAAAARSGPNLVRQKMESHPHGTVPVFRWDPCETENLTECGGRMAVTGLVVGVALNCTFMPEASGLARALAGDAMDPRRHLWQISAAPGKTLKPPIVYGILPEGAVQDWPADGKAPQVIPANCDYSTFVSDGADMVKAVQKNLEKMERKGGPDPFAGAEPEGTHAVQKLAGKQECFLGSNRMALASGVVMNVPTLMRRATDGATVVEDNVTVSPGQKPARTAYRFTAGPDGTHALVMVGGAATGKGTYVAGTDHWAAWTLDIEFAGAGTRVQGDVSRGEGTLVTRGKILAGGKAVMTYDATLEALDDARCEALFSRIPPLPGL